MFRKAKPGGRCQRCRRPARIAFWWKDAGWAGRNAALVGTRCPGAMGTASMSPGRFGTGSWMGKPRMVGKCDLCSEMRLLHSTTSVSAAFYGTDEIANAETNACEICVDRLRKKAPSKTYACVKGKIVRIAK